MEHIPKVSGHRLVEVAALAENEAAKCTLGGGNLQKANI